MFILVADITPNICDPLDYSCLSSIWIENHSGFVALVTLIVTICFFFWQHKREKNAAKDDLNKRICRTIDSVLIDLKVIHDDMEPGKYEHDTKFDFTYIQIGTEVYDGFLGSGLFTYLEEITQKELGNFYFNIKLHNRVLIEKNSHAMEFGLEYGSKDRTVYEKVNDKYGKNLEDYEKEIKRLLPVVKDYLTKDKKLYSD